jgi:anti-sigma-K factor RskA
MTIDQITTWAQISLSLVTTIAWIKEKRRAAHAEASLKIWRGVALASIAALAVVMLKKNSDNEGVKP